MRAIAWPWLVMLPVGLMTSCGLSTGGDETGFKAQGGGATSSTEIGGFPATSPGQGGSTTHAGGKGTSGGGAGGGVGGASGSGGSSSSAVTTGSTAQSSSGAGGAPGCHPSDATTVCCPDVACGPGNGMKCCQFRDTFACGNGNCGIGYSEFACDDSRDCGSNRCCGFFDGHYNGSACRSGCGAGSLEMCDLDDPSCASGTTCMASSHLPAPHGFCQ